MRHIISFEGKSFRNDTEAPLAFALFGQRDADFLRPNVSAEKVASGDVTGEEYVQLAQHAHRQTSGYFAMHPLVWTETQEQAEAAKATFPAPEWINHTIIPVRTTINGS